MKTGGLWVHKVERCGGAAQAVRSAQAMQAERLIVKARDGRSKYNRAHLLDLSKLCKQAEIDLWLWSWNYSSEEAASATYCAEQGDLIAEDADRFSASGVLLNLEAPFSWAPNHRWAELHGKLYGSKAYRKQAMHDRATELIDATRQGLPGSAQLGISTFPIPSQHGLPFGVFADKADLICPQIYFSGVGYKTKARKSIEQWEKLGAKRIRFSGPGWRGETKLRAMGSAVRLQQCARAPIDFWVLDKMTDKEIEAARIFGEASRRCPINF